MRSPNSLATFPRTNFATSSLITKPANRSSIGRALLVVALGVALVAIPKGVFAARPLGIDVSSYQGSAQNPPTHITWASVPGGGISFAWAKATEGTGVIDADFTFNEINGKTNGIYMGAYHFAHPNDNTPGAEAGYFWGEAGPYILADGKTLMPMLDMEVFSGIVGATTYSQWANDWCVDITSDAANAGVTVKPFIYVSACNAGNFDTSVAQWFSDIANYGSVNGGNDPQSGTPWSSCAGDDVWGSGVWHVWQYESVGSTPGVNGNCDEDVYNGTLAQLTSSSIATVSGNGAIYYWDPQGSTGSNPYTGSMTGTWENSDWSGSAGGQTTPIAWVEGKASCFGVHTGTNTPAYTVTMNSNHTVAGFFDGALTPNACDITIAGAGTIILAGGPQALDAHNASDGSSAFLRINCAIGGIGQMFPEGNGQSFLNGTNFFSGGVKFGYDDTNGSNPFSGTVNFNNGSSFGTGTITFWQYGSGGALVLEGTSATTVTNPVTVASATTNNIVGNAAGLTFSGPWTLSASFNIGSGGASGNLITISGPISGSGGLTKFNPGILALSGANSYTGANLFEAGTVQVSADNNLGAVPGSVTAASISLSNVTLNATSSFTLNSKRGITLKANSTILVNSGQTLSYGGAIAGSGFGITKSGSGTLMLANANTYTGATSVTGGTLILTNGGAIGASVVTISSGATLAHYNLLGINTIGGAVTLNSGALASFLVLGPNVVTKLSVSGNLTLNNNAVTINFASPESLVAGTYRLMDCTGTLSGSANPTPTITGTTLTPGLTATIATTAGAAGHFDLVISKSTPAFSGLTSGATVPYGTTGITLGGTLSAPGPVYPAMGETVTVTINGNAQNTTINDATGDFSINYALAGIPASGTPYTITYSYAGNSVLNAASDASTTLTLNPLPAVLTGTRPFDGTNDAPASILSVANKVGSDAVTVASGSGTLAGSSVGSQAITSFGTLALGGAAAGNYTLVGASGTVTITSTTFAITSSSVDSTGTNFIITFQSTPGTSYRVIGSTNLSTALSTWTNVSGPIVASGTSTSVTNPIISSLNFFSVASP